MQYLIITNHDPGIDPCHLCGKGVARRPGTMIVSFIDCDALCAGCAEDHAPYVWAEFLKIMDTYSPTDYERELVDLRKTTKPDVRSDQDTPAWKIGYADGMANSWICPYPLDTEQSLLWRSGFIEGTGAIG